MSNNVNTELLERASELIENYNGGLWDRILQRDIDAGDLDALKYHVHEAEAQKAIEDENDLLGSMPDPWNPSDDATVLSDVKGEYPDVF